RGGASFARPAAEVIASPTPAAYPDPWRRTVLGVPQQIEEPPCRTKLISTPSSRWPESAPRSSHFLCLYAPRIRNSRHSPYPTPRVRIAPPKRQKPRKSSTTKTLLRVRISPALKV